MSEQFDQPQSPSQPQRSAVPAGAVDETAVGKALPFFKVMAFVVGVGLLLLVAAMIVRYGFGHPQLAQTWSPIHGFLYMVYLVATANLGFKLRWSVGKIVGVMLAGVVPFLSFWIERRVAGEVEAKLGR